MTAAPIEQILPSFVPIQIAQALTGYYEVPLQLEAERRLDKTELGHLITAASFLGTLLFTVQAGFDFVETREKLASSLQKIPQATIEGSEAVLNLVETFHSHSKAPMDASLDDWMARAWWAKFQSCAYGYPTAMSGAIAHGLGIIDVLKTFRIEA